MPESVHGDWVVGIASLLAAILGGAVTFLFERLKASKREIQFFISEPQTITGDLQGHGREFKVMLGDQVTSELNVSLVRVTNEGNEPIENLNFDVTIPGERKIMLAECMSPSESLKKAVDISFSDRIPQINPVFNIRLPFFNPKESFFIKTLVDGEAAASVVSCRMPGTTIKFLTQEDIYARYRRRGLWQTAVLVSILFAVTAVFAYVLFTTSSNLAHSKALIKRMPTDFIEQELEDRKSQSPPVDHKSQ